MNPKLRLSRGFLAAYSGCLTLVLGGLLLTGVADTARARFKTIDVERINVREPDGTVRMVISGRQSFPGLLIRGREYAHQRSQAGMLFYNDEGTEQGGLIFHGRRDAQGKVDSAVSLTADRYEQDQQLQLLGVDEDGKHFAGLTVNDRPERTILETIEEGPRLAAMPPGEIKTLMEERKRTHHYGARRLYVGKTEQQTSTVQLADASGNVRLALSVTPDGQASLQFLDASGNVVGEVTPASAAKSSAKSAGE